MRSKDNFAMALASFNILVPLQPFGKFNANYLTSFLIPAGLVAISLSAIVIALIIISRKKRKQKDLQINKGKKRKKRRKR